MHPISFAVQRPSRGIAIAVALFAAAATIGLSGIGAPVSTLPALAAALGVDRAAVIGPALALLAGLIACRMASMTVEPPQSLGHAALPSALAALVLLPDAGTGALLPALIAAAALPLAGGAHRATAILVLCGALVALLAAASQPIVAGFVIMIMALAGGVSVRASRPIAANDNGARRKWGSAAWLGRDPAHVTFAGESSGVMGEACSTTARATIVRR